VQSTCVSCGSTRLVWARTYACRDRQFAARVYPDLAVLRCESCGLVQADHARIATERLTAWRRADEGRRAARPTAPQELAWLEARARALANVARRFKRTEPVERIYQLGAGAGLDLIALQGVHPRAECFADWLEGSAASTSMAQVATLAAGPFDLVLATHVLARSPDPVGLLQRITASLREGALLIVEERNDRPGALASQEAFEPRITFFERDSLARLFRTNFADDLEPLSIATAGPRPDDEPAEPEPRKDLWSRVLGRRERRREELPVPELDDDPEADDRALVRAVLRRKKLGN